MSRDSRLSNVLHALLHMAEIEGPSTSEALARSMRTNPVVARRLMAGLRDAGFVLSAKGHSGGWVLSCPLAQITLGDIHRALGSPALLAIGHRSEQPGCLVEQAVNTALGAAFHDAEQLLLRRLDQVSLAQLSQDFHRRMQERGLHIQEMTHE